MGGQLGLGTWYLGWVADDDGKSWNTGYEQLGLGTLSTRASREAPVDNDYSI